LQANDIGHLFLKQFGLRLAPHMCRYIASRLHSGLPLPDVLPVMGGDARTGVPVRYLAPVVGLTALAKEVPEN
jgi:hypothetical protein